MAWYNSLKDLTGDIGHAATTVGHAVGDVASNPWTKAALAAALAATGVGAPAAAALLAGEGALGGALAPGGGLKPALVGGAEGAATGALAGGVGSLAHGAAGAAQALSTPAASLSGTAGGALGSAGIPGLSGVAQGIGNAASGLGGLVSQIPGLSGVAQAAGKSGVGNLLGGLGSFLGGNSGANALGIAQGLNAASLQQSANQYATNAMGDVNAQWNAAAPLRAQALAQLPGALNANPFSRGTASSAIPNSGGLVAQPIARGGA